MPIYTYRCRTCDYEFDKEQRMSEDPLTDCPDCGQPQLRKVVNSVGVVFKGSGFYVTDNRNGSAKAAGAKADAPAKKTEGEASAASSADSSATPAATTAPAPEKSTAVTS
jgi:putative FmdB family regulatory protein